MNDNIQSIKTFLLQENPDVVPSICPFIPFPLGQIESSKEHLKEDNF